MHLARAILVATAALVALSACGPAAAPKTNAELAAEALERGIQADNAGRTNDAIAAYFETLSRDPRNKFAFYNLGQIYRRSNELQIAEGYYRQALKVDPGMTVALFGVGFTRLAAGDFAAAADANQKVTAADPNNAAAWFNLGLALRNLGREPDAQQAFARANQLDRNLTAPPPPTRRP